jgi:glycosyltransferase involved in cell wall biosynthesis
MTPVYTSPISSGSPAEPRPDVSVIICTLNRCELLQRTLELLDKQTLPRGKNFEIIVVDNNSTDATRQVAVQTGGRLAVPVYYILEERAGLSFARNTGMDRARGDILVFTDDDMIFSDSWLMEIYTLFAIKPAPACVTGPVEVHRDSHPSLQPDIIRGRRRYRYPTEPWDVGRGNNMSFRRRYLEEAGPFDTRIGAGSASGSGEDTDMFYRILKAGGEIVADPGVSVYHDHRRHSPQEIESIVTSYAIGGTAFLIKHIVRFDLFAFKLLYWRYLSFRRGVRLTAGDDTFSPPISAIQVLYMRGYYRGIRRGFLNLFKRS